MVSQNPLTIHLHRGLPSHTPGINVKYGSLVLFSTVQSITIGRGQHTFTYFLSERTPYEIKKNELNVKINVQ